LILILIWKLFGWIGKPGVGGKYEFALADMAAMHIQMNLEGFWDDRHKIVKPRNAKRILFLGDSFTIGYGINRPSRFTDRIKEALPDNYQVINMGMWGYGTDQEFLVLKEKALKYMPDIVGLVLFLDDLYTTNVFSVNGGEFIKPKFVLEQDGSLNLTNIPVPHNHTRSLFYNFIVSRFYHLRNIIKVGRSFCRRDWFSIFDRRFYKENLHVLTLRLISEIHSLVQEKGMKFFLVIVPFRDQVLVPDAAFQTRFRSGGMPGTCIEKLLPQKVIGSFARMEKMPVLDLYPCFQKHAKGAPLFFKQDIHWTGRGHQLAADEILKFLRSVHYVE